MTNNTYNGWLSYENWNRTLYISNEYQFYKAACSYVAHNIYLERPIVWKEFYGFFMDLLGTHTPDDVSWTEGITHKEEVELTEYLMEFIEQG